MTEKAEKVEKVENDGKAVAVSADPEALANSLRLEQAKTKVLLDEVMALEDLVVNRCMEDFEAVVSEETREFWREQLLANREPALAALNEMKRCVAAATGLDAAKARRPLHNRAEARPVIPGQGDPSTGSGLAAGAAARMRNRAHEIVKAERIPFSAAFRRAEKESGGVGSRL